MSNIPLNKYLTLTDYFNLLLDERGKQELIDGILTMSPSPSSNHARMVRHLTKYLINYFDDKTCEFFADHDVQLFQDEPLIYRPDLLVVCDRSKITEQQILGAPDFIVEVGSPSTLNRDLTKKRTDYERAGVAEYWVMVSPVLVYTYCLNADGKFEETVHRNPKSIKVHSFDELVIDFSRLQQGM
ncbi:MAG: Uma2 family endonuclease [Spirochaetaceae bacterium]|nr:Uma2 family endonuclease [Spirochaetaceae bacterium]